MSAAAERRAHRRRATAELRNRRREYRAHRDATSRVKVSDFLAGLGMSPEDVTKYGSWAGRHIAGEYRAANGHQPRQTRKRTAPCKGHPNGRWIKVNVYRAADPALMAGALAYKRTAPYAQNAYATAA